MKRRNPAANEKEQVRNYPTPNLMDVVFYEYRDYTLPKNQNPEYGVTTPEHGNWPNHKLAFILPENEDGLQKWVYVANRENQDDYNYELNGDSVVRTYVIPRSEYNCILDGEEGSEIEFTYPVVATPDNQFPMFGFADDTLVRSNDPEIDSRYVVIKRKFIRPVTVEYVYDAQFRRNVRVTKEVIPRTTSSPALGSNGTSIEIQDGNYFYSVRITKELVLEGEETYPYALPDIPATQDYRFPSKLESVDLIGAWAWASAADQRDSYSEDYYFKFKITDPRPGPYSATIERWITDDPDSIKAGNPVTIVPQPIRESIAVAAAWFYASSVHGNATSATAKEWSVPPTIHTEIAVNLGGTADTTKAQDRTFTTTLAATPGAADFLALTQAVVDYRVREMPLGLYEVSVVRLDITGLYT